MLLRVTCYPVCSNSSMTEYIEVPSYYTEEEIDEEIEFLYYDYGYYEWERIEDEEAVELRKHLY